MKIACLEIILSFLLMVTSYSNLAHADSTDPVQILDVHVEPSMLKVNDTFLVSATILNSSPYSIYLTSGSCTPAFSISFDIHAKQVYPNITCTTEAILQKVDPEGKVTISNVNKPGIIYQAVWAGNTNANITIPYFAKNQTATDYSNINYNASKSFSFTIYDSKTSDTFNYAKQPVLEENMTLSRHPAHPAPMLDLPLTQFKQGVLAKNIQCNDGLILVLKAEDKTPACVKPDTAQKLIERGWAANMVDNAENRTIKQTVDRKFPHPPDGFGCGMWSNATGWVKGTCVSPNIPHP